MTKARDLANLGSTATTLVTHSDLTPLVVEDIVDSDNDTWISVTE